MAGGSARGCARVAGGPLSIPYELGELAAEYGVQLEYYDATGIKRCATVDGVTAILRSLGVEVGAGKIRELLEQRRAELRSQLVAPVLVAWDGELDLRAFMPLDARLELRLEDGSARDGRSNDGLPLGYHELDVHVGAR